MNTWPSGKREVLDQNQHEAWNAKNWPGTRQLCCICEEATGRCEDDSIYFAEVGPICESCFDEKNESER